MNAIDFINQFSNSVSNGGVFSASGNVQLVHPTHDLRHLDDHCAAAGTAPSAS